MTANPAHHPQHHAKPRYTALHHTTPPPQHATPQHAAFAGNHTFATATPNKYHQKQPTTTADHYNEQQQQQQQQQPTTTSTHTQLHTDGWSFLLVYVCFPLFFPSFV